MVAWMRSEERTGVDSMHEFGQRAPSQRSYIAALHRIDHMDRGDAVAWLQVDHDRSRVN
jgi:hypothetical protein